MPGSMPMKTRVQLSAMMFLQFMMLPVWFVPLTNYVGTQLSGGGSWVFWFGMIMGFGTLSSVIFGMFADRFLNSEKVLAICNFVTAALLVWAYTIKDPKVLFFVMLCVMVFYMPTWSLSATIAMENSSTEAFPQIRVFGTIGWIASSIFSIVGLKYFGVKNFDSTPYIFLCGAGTALVGALVAFTLPATPPKAKGQPMSLVDALGLRALSLFKRWDFTVFAVLILLAMIPFQWYMSYNGMYLSDKGVKLSTAITSLGQVGEIVFTLLIPFILAKCGYKWTMVIGLGALAFRYAMFYCGAMNVPYCDLAAILIHGLIFGLLVVGGQMYINTVAPPELRNQAQGLINLIESGIGAFVSGAVFGKIIDASAKPALELAKEKAVALTQGTVATTHDWSKPYLIALVASLILMVLMAVLFQPQKPGEKQA